MPKDSVSQIADKLASGVPIPMASGTAEPRPDQPREKPSRWFNAAFTTILILAFLLVMALIREVHDRVIISRYIDPNPDDATTLTLTRRHWFASDDKIYLKARPDPDDTNAVIWMYRAKDGTWNRMFYEDYQ